MEQQIEGTALEAAEQGPGIAETFNRMLARAIAISAGVIIPAGLLISGIWGGWRGLAGALVGFGVASAYTVAALWMMRWALGKPAERILPILSITLVVRLLAVGVTLFALMSVSALNKYAFGFCFLALFLDYTILEAFCAWRTYGLLLKKP